MKSKKMSTGKKVAIGAGVTAGVAAVGAGAYYLFGPHAKAHQKKAKALVAKVTKEVKAEAKKAKVATMPLYHKAVDAVLSKYHKEYNLHHGDVKALAKKLKGEWKAASGAASRSVKKLRRKI